ncbi:MAG: hypothetical protein KC535_04910, partial [Nanoarchaeota archaeon]|nr:hypothetical protein [Nanoarchaeota archaeon]
MGVELIVEPRKEYSKESFIKEKPPYSIALDGIISSPTFRLVEGPYANFDHHSGVDRLTTFSAAAQVNYEIQTGLFNTFSKEGKPYARLYVNSCDEDVAMSTWLLCNHQQHHGNKKLEELLYYQDKRDITGGMY